MNHPYPYFLFCPHNNVQGKVKATVKIIGKLTGKIVVFLCCIRIHRVSHSSVCEWRERKKFSTLYIFLLLLLMCSFSIAFCCFVYCIINILKIYAHFIFIRSKIFFFRTVMYAFEGKVPTHQRVFSCSNNNIFSIEFCQHCK